MRTLVSIPMSPWAECAWCDHLCMAINIAHLGVDNLDWVMDGCPDQAVRNRLDEVFTSWVGLHLAVGALYRMMLALTIGCLMVLGNLLPKSGRALWSSFE